MINGAYIVEERDDRLFPHNINRSCLDGWVNADRYPARMVKATPFDHDTSALTDKARAIANPIPAVPPRCSSAVPRTTLEPLAAPVISESVGVAMRPP